MSPQPEQTTNGRHAELEELYRRGAILREAARRARATAREIREASPLQTQEEPVASGQD
jgi:hypothetical protein